jgi:hypothetical protein
MHLFVAVVTDDRSLQREQFLSKLDTVEAEESAYACLAKRIESLVGSGIHQQILSILKEECNKQAQREVKSEEDEELRILRYDFVRQIEDLSRERSKSYVPISSG